MAFILNTTSDYVSGDKGLCELLQCGRTTVYRLKKSGLLNESAHKFRGKTLYDVAKIMELTKLS